MQDVQIVIQVTLLAAVAAIGIGFTFALPKPRHQLKAKSARYARWFLFTAWLVVFFQALCSYGYPSIGSPGLYGAAVLSAYMMLMSVNKRYGYAVSTAKKYAAGVHVMLLVAITYLVLSMQYPSWINHSLALSSAALPVWLAKSRVSKHLSSDSMGGQLLMAVLLSVLGALLIGGPVYLGVSSPDSLYHFTATFAFMLILMLVFMLAYAVNILQSLLLKLRSQVHTDPLTGAKNRHYFYEVAPKLNALANRNKEVLSLVACDIDYFKTINDEHGHVIGDIALKRFCTLIKEQLRLEDTLIRMGGEEFLILSLGCDVKQATLLAERLRATISESTIEAQGVYLSLTASFGVIEMTPGADLYKTVKCADDALYNAKANGRNQVIVV